MDALVTCTYEGLNDNKHVFNNVELYNITNITKTHILTLREKIELEKENINIKLIITECTD
jgi:hypothetical protein